MKNKAIMLSFPEVQLMQRDAHKLRGFFISLQPDNELLHNHTGGKYQYPKVQYKVINGKPSILAFNEAIPVIEQLALNIRNLNIDGNYLPVYKKNIRNIEIEQPKDETNKYRFLSLWMPLNQSNYKQYKELKTDGQRSDFLNKLLQGNILSMYKGLGIRVNHRIECKGLLRPKKTQFKEQQFACFEGEFYANINLPKHFGIGKSVSRGFGVIEKIK